MSKQKNGSQDEVLERHVNYLHDDTPLSRQQSEILARRQLQNEPEEIAESLNIEDWTVNKHWSNLTTKLQQSKHLVDLFGHEPPEYKPTETPLWQNPWELLSSAEYSLDDTAISLRLYLDPRYRVDGWNYLLVEHRTEHPQFGLTTTTTTKCVVQSDGLRRRLYQNAASLKDWAARERLLEESGIDPGATGAISPEDAFGVDWNSEEAKKALEEMEQYVDREENTQRL